MQFNFKEFLDGWRNHLIPPKEMEELIMKVHEDRMAICRTCPMFSENRKQEGYKTARKDEHCTACGCPLIAKTKSLSSRCPLDPPKWDAITTPEERHAIERSIKESKKNEENETEQGSDRSDQRS